MKQTANRLVLEAREVDFKYPGGDFGLGGVDLEIRTSRALALVGFNAQGKSTLCRLLGKVSLPHTPARGPDRGRVFYSPRGSFAKVDPYASTLLTSAIVGVGAAALIAASLAFATGSYPDLSRAVPILACSAVIAWAVETLRRRLRDSWYRSRVVYASRAASVVEILATNLPNAAGHHRTRHG